MYRKIEDFIRDWEYEVEGTKKILAALTDQSLAQTVTDKHRTLGRLAWHITVTIPEMIGHTGLSVSGVDQNAPAPAQAAIISDAYARAAASLTAEVRSKWNDATLEVEDEIYGGKWKRGLTLSALMFHQAHHRGQMTVLMRQAGLRVPGLYGPSLEEWGEHGMPAPAL